MTALTTTYQFRKPSGTDSPDLVVLVGNLADDVDTLLTAQLAALATTYRATTLLGGVAASVTFAGIPSTLRAVEIKWSARSDAAVINTAIFCRINGDSSTVYSGQKMQAANTALSATPFVTQAQADCGSILAGSAIAGRFAAGDLVFSGWDAHGKLNCTARWGGFDVAATNSFTGQSSWMYEAAAPFTSITLLPGGGNFIAGSEFALVGWK